jgi:hypothetical protein
MPSTMPSTVTHVAGIVFRIGERVIQRCCVCGEKLCDNLNTAMPLKPDGSVPEFPVWEEMALVQHEGNRWSLIEPERNDAGEPKLPTDSCIALVE